MSIGAPEPNLLKRCGRWVRRTRPAQSCGGWLHARQYRLGSPGGRPDRAVSWLLRHEMVTPSQRQDSVDKLVELFFALVDTSGAGRFVEAGAKDAGASVRAVNGCGIKRVHAFEANPYTYRRFAESVVSEGVDYRNAALANGSNSVEFLVRLSLDGTPMADGQGSMLVRPDHDPGYQTVVVDATSLDAEFADDERISTALWIDVEGASSEVLRGGHRVLEATDVVHIEVEERVAWEGQEWLHLDVVEYLGRAGLIPVARDLQSRYQFNVVFASRRLLTQPETAQLLRRWRSRRSSPKDL